MPSQGEYSRALATALSDLEGPYTLSSSTASTAVSALLVNGTTGASTERYNQRWIYVATGAQAGNQRRVRTSGYAPSTGTLTIYPDWTSPGAVDVDLTGLFPRVAPPGTASYRALVNRALSMLVLPDEISLAITTLDEYSLATWVYWLDRPERFVRLLEPSPITNRAPVDATWRVRELSFDAELPKLRLRAPFSTGVGNMTLEVRRPANTWIKAAGVWGESTNGLVSEADEARPPVADVVEVALAEAYRVLMNRAGDNPADPTIGAKYTAQLARARAVKGYDRTLETSSAPLQEAA